MLKRWIRNSLFAALVAVSASVVPADAAAQDSPALDRIIETSTLRVGMSGSQPPFNMKARDGAPMGLEVDLANALAAAMKVELQIVEMPFADLIPALENGEVDLPEVVAAAILVLEPSGKSTSSTGSGAHY